MAGTDELERMIEHVAGDVQKVEEAHGTLNGQVHEFMVASARTNAELAGYVKNAALDISAVRKSSEKSSEALQAAIAVMGKTLTDEITERKVADTEQDGKIKTVKVELIGRIRNAGYAKIVAFIASAALLVIGASSIFGG